MMQIDNRCYAARLTHDFTINDACDVCAATFGSARCMLLVIAEYRTPWIAQNDTQEWCNQIDQLAASLSKIFIADINFLKMQRRENCVHSDIAPEQVFRFLLADLGLIQVATLPNQESSLLDFVYITSHYNVTNVVNMRQRPNPITMLSYLHFKYR